MKRTSNLLRLLSGAVIASLAMAACAPVATPAPTEAPAPTSAPAPTEAPAPTAVPTQAPEPTSAPAYEGLSFEAPNCDYGGEFKKMEAVDQYTVKFTLCAPDVAFPAKVAFSAFAINDTAYLEQTGGGGELIEKPNGTGPYKLKEWKRGDQMIFERNEDYWGEKVAQWMALITSAPTILKW
jgi:ABC-type oligopeptide transport system substrate-binding subunit